MEHRQWVSRFRSELKGLAILWIVFFHSGLVLGGSWDLIRQTGYGGVDIFFFLMGMGLYHSLQKSSELSGYLSRRLWRILPAYLPLVLMWMLVMYPGYGLSTVQAIRGVAGNLTMTGYWLDTPKVFNWFVSAQFFMMLLAPLCFALLYKSRKPGAMLLALLGLAGCLGLAGVGLDQMMGVSRLPVFLLGMAFSMDWLAMQEKKTVRIAYAGAFLIGAAVLLICLTRYRELLNDYGLYWYPFALMTPGLCVGIAFGLQKAEHARRWFAPLRWIGEASFEIYLVNIWLVELAKANGWTDDGVWALLCIGNLLLGMGYHRVVVWGTRRLRRQAGAVPASENS